MMRAGLLREVIRILSPVETKTEYGDTSIDWQVYNITRARVQHNSGSRNDDNNELQNTYHYTFTVRPNNRVNEKMVIEWNGNHYRIMSIDTTDRQKVLIETEIINE